MAFNKLSHFFHIHYARSELLIVNAKQFKLIRFSFFIEIVICQDFIQNFLGNVLFSCFFQLFPVSTILFELFIGRCFDILVIHEKVSLK